MKLSFSKNEISAIRAQCCPKGTTDAELFYFLSYAEKTKLDPLTRQIYCTKDKTGKFRVETTIDGFRVIAERTTEYAGQTEPLFANKKGEWTELWISSPEEKNPYAAKVGVHRRGFKEPIYAVAHWESYAKPYGPWTQYPSIMLAKCAESQALRKAFPNDLSGLYTAEEMGTDIEKTEIKAEAPKDE